MNSSSMRATSPRRRGPRPEDGFRQPAQGVRIFRHVDVEQGLDVVRERESRADDGLGVDAEPKCEASAVRSAARGSEARWSSSFTESKKV